MTKQEIIEMIEAHIIKAIEQCADAEYYDTVKDLDVGHFLTIHKIFGVAQYAAINMNDELIKHEQDTLKEFVEWLKGVYAKDYDDKGKIADKSIGRGDKENFWYMEGQQTALQRIIDLLDQDLENFIKEKSDER